MSDRIKKETDDVFILDNLNGLLVFFLVLVFILWIFLNASFIILAFTTFLAYETVIMDKKLQSVVIKNFLNVKNLYFSDIIRVEIEDYSNAEGSAWRINIITNQEGPIKIFETHNESKADDVAEKIRIITGMQPLYRVEKNKSYSHQDGSHGRFRWQ